MKTYLLALSALSFPAFAQDNIVTQQEAMAELENALLVEPVYAGQTSSTTDADGTFCEKATTWSVYWKASLGDLSLELSEDETSAKVHLEFVDSSVDASGFRKGGVLCMWQGGSGRASVGKVSVDFTLHALDQSAGGPQIDLQGFRIDGLHLDRMDVALPFYTHLNGSAPDWLDQLLENKINFFVRQFLATALKQRLNSYLNGKLRAYLEKAKREGFTGT